MRPASTISIAHPHARPTLWAAWLAGPAQTPACLQPQRPEKSLKHAGCVRLQLSTRRARGWGGRGGGEACLVGVAACCTGPLPKRCACHEGGALGSTLRDESHSDSHSWASGSGAGWRRAGRAARRRDMRERFAGGICGRVRAVRLPDMVISRPMIAIAGLETSQGMVEA